METKHYINIDVVKQLMKEQNISEKRLAELIEVTLPTVKKFLKSANQSKISLVTIFRIARALEVNISTILKNE